MNWSESQRITESLFGPVAWSNEKHGFCPCPGQSRHTRPTGRRDCVIHLDGVPTIFCLHTSCAGEVEAANRALRRALAGDKRPAWPAPACHPRATHQAPTQAERLAAGARLKLPEILRDHSCALAAWWESSPIRPAESPADDWRLLLALFKPDDVLWIGQPYDSGPQFTDRFRPASAWLDEAHAPGPFTCPNPFKPGVCSRSNANIAGLRFLVVESDTLTKPECAAVFQWLRQFLDLRAIVDTAGKSLHAWFDYPDDPELLAELRIILPSLQCDPALFRPCQPCRLPGARRGSQFQRLLWLKL